jgi:four helix bundle protein
MSYRNLFAYQKGFELAMEIFTITKDFPPDERYSLTDQVRRSSRAGCANLAEGYRKRQYPAHFVAKLSDSDMENSETVVWLEFALRCGYITLPLFERLQKLATEVGNLLNHMIKHPAQFGALDSNRGR